MRRAARRALRLLVWFHLAALALVGLLLGLAALTLAGIVYFAKHEYIGDHVSGLSVIFAACVIAAVVVLASLVPRPGRLVVGGPELTARDAPELFEDLRLLGASFGLRARLRVFLSHECSAWAEDRGGWFGFGRQHILSIGLPLFELLPRDQLRGVIARELARMRNDDGLLATLAVRGRVGTSRAANDLRETSRFVGDDFERFPTVLKIARLPFALFYDAYERVTESIVDARDSRASTFASELVGRDALSTARTTMHREAAVYAAFHAEELLPLLARGVRPPVVEGYRQFRRSRRAEEIRGGAPRLLDEHREDSALDLLADSNGIEVRLAAHGRRAELSVVDWEALGSRVWVPLWRQRPAADREMLAGTTMATLPRDIPRIRERTAGRGLPVALTNDDDALLRWWRDLCGGALCLALLERGWTVRVRPGESIAMSNGELKCLVFTELTDYLFGVTDLRQWQQRALEVGLAERDLALVI